MALALVLGSEPAIEFFSNFMGEAASGFVEALYESKDDESILKSAYEFISKLEEDPCLLSELLELTKDVLGLDELKYELTQLNIEVDHLEDRISKLERCLRA